MTLLLPVLIALALCCVTGAGARGESADPPLPSIVFREDDGWETVYSLAKEGCPFINSHGHPGDMCDSMPIAWRSPTLNQTLLVSAVDYGTIANIGPTLGTVKHDCKRVVFNSTFKLDPQTYANRQWLQSVHMFPNGSSFGVGLAHNEFHGENQVPKYCNASSASSTCGMWSTGLVVTHDGGATFQLARPPPQHLVAALPYRYEIGAPLGGFGAISVMITADDGRTVYGLVNALPRGDQRGGLCAFRATDPTDPTSYRAWNGTDFGTQWLDPYTHPDLTPADHVCQPVLDNHLGGHPGLRRLVPPLCTKNQGSSTCYHFVMQGWDGLGGGVMAFSTEPDIGRAITSWVPGVTRFQFPQALIYPALLDAQSPFVLPGHGQNYEIVSTATASTYLYGVVSRSMIVRHRVSFSFTPPVPPPPPPPAAPCVAYLVSGAGTTQANGLYRKTNQTSDNAPVFLHMNSESDIPAAGTSDQLTLYRFQGVWRAGVQGQKVFYMAWLAKSAPAPPQTGWLPVLGSDPAPTSVHCTTS